MKLKFLTGLIDLIFHLIILISGVIYHKQFKYENNLTIEIYFSWYFFNFTYFLSSRLHRNHNRAVSDTTGINIHKQIITYLMLCIYIVSSP